MTRPAHVRHLFTPTLGAMLLVNLCLILARPTTAAAQAPSPAGACAPSLGLNFICGPSASEDLVRIPGTPWLIASGMNVGAAAHLYLIDTRAKRASVAYPSTHAPARAAHAADAQCPGPPDPERMSLDGLALRAGTGRRHMLFAANHGDRMAIEMFTVESGTGRPRLRWLDCALLPEHILPNAVTTLPGDGLLVISFYDPSDPQAWSKMAAGKMTGRILQWHPGRGFSELPDSATSGGNGLETSADGTLVYASSWSARRLVVLSLPDRSRREIPLNFMPDNIHRLADGSLLVAGQRATVDAIHACGPQCPQVWVVARVQPDSGTVRELLSGAGNAQVNYACGAIAVNGTVYVTVRGDRRIAWHRFAEGSFLQ